MSKGDYESDVLLKRFWQSDRPSKLWADMYPALSPLGWTWPRFISLLKICGAEVLWHMTGGADGTFLKDMVFGFATGEVGKAILKRHEPN